MVSAIADAPAVVDNEGLNILGHQVVSYWEQSIQEALAKSASQFGGKVLELGYGLGLANNILKKKITSDNLTIIESNKQIAQAAIQANPESNVIIDSWENAIDLLEDDYFDGIVYDTFPFNYEGNLSDIETILDWVAEGMMLLFPKLHVGGVFCFLDLSCELDRKTLGAVVPKNYELRIRSLESCAPQSCDYATEFINVVEVHKY